VPDAIFAHPRLAPVYDAFDGGRDDLAAYLDIACELGADRVLDVGCGTGCLAVLLAGSGRTVVGVDPAEASLEVAKAKDAAARVTWVHGDATAVAAFGADLAVMTGNVAQVFLTDADWGQVLAGIHAALRPGGYLVFETRRPDRRAWEDWAADTGPVTLDIPGTGWVERRNEVGTATRWNQACSPTATECWMCEKPLIAQVASSCSSPSARPEPMVLAASGIATVPAWGRRDFVATLAVGRRCASADPNGTGFPGPGAARRARAQGPAS
jgi:SAM-dependent methyltransferase